MGILPKETVQTMIYKALHRKLNIQQKELNLNPGMNSGVPDVHAVTVSNTQHLHPEDGQYPVCIDVIIVPLYLIYISQNLVTLYKTKTFENTKGEFISRNLKDRQYNGKKGQNEKQ